MGSCVSNEGQLRIRQVRSGVVAGLALARRIRVRHAPVRAGHHARVLAVDLSGTRLPEERGHFDLAVGLAAVSREGVAVVALLVGLHRAVAARSLDRTVRATTVEVVVVIPPQSITRSNPVDDDPSSPICTNTSTLPFDSKTPDRNANDRAAYPTTSTSNTVAVVADTMTMFVSG